MRPGFGRHSAGFAVRSAPTTPLSARLARSSRSPSGPPRRPSPTSREGRHGVERAEAGDVRRAVVYEDRLDTGDEILPLPPGFRALVGPPAALAPSGEPGDGDRVVDGRGKPRRHLDAKRVYLALQDGDRRLLVEARDEDAARAFAELVNLAALNVDRITRVRSEAGAELDTRLMQVRREQTAVVDQVHAKLLATEATERRSRPRRGRSRTPRRTRPRSSADGKRSRPSSEPLPNRPPSSAGNTAQPGIGWQAQVDLLLRNGTIVTAAETYQADVGIEGGTVKRIGFELGPAARVVDVSGKYLFPGGIDVHTHVELGEDLLGHGTADDFFSSTAAAACGGVTTIVDYVFPAEGQSLQDAIETWIRNGTGKSVIDYGLHPVIRDPRDEVIAEMADVVAEGFTSFKIFTTSLGRFDELAPQYLKAMREAGRLGALVNMHCEDQCCIDFMTAELDAQGQAAGVRHYPDSRPRAAGGSRRSAPSAWRR